MRRVNSFLHFTNVFKIGLTLFNLYFCSVASAEAWHSVSNCIKYTELYTHVHVIKANLECQGLEFVGTDESARGITTSEFAIKTGAAIAINGDFFNSGFLPRGLNITNGLKWLKSEDKKDRSFIACTGNNRCVIDPIDHQATPQTDWRVVIGGWQTYKDGRFACAESATQSCTRTNAAVTHPRTAIGLDEGRQILFLVVVEGRLPDFPGMTLDDLAGVFRKLGIAEGLNLDGGGSSTLVIHGRRVNQLPSSQHDERKVANHFGIVIR